MFYFVLNSDRAVVAVKDGRSEAYLSTEGAGSVTYRGDWKTFAEAEAIAVSATIATGDRYIPTDAGQNHWPRFDVVRAYEVGDEVSISFNGDAYPAGKIVRISASGRVITTTDRRFYRVGETGSWRSEGTWFLARGHFSKQNPHL